MGKYYITNGEKYLTCSEDSGIIIGVPATQAKRLKYEYARSTLPFVQTKIPDEEWGIQKYFSAASHLNYVITNATKFVGDNDLIVNEATKARSFKTAADAEGYIQSHGELMFAMKKLPIIVNNNYQTVDIFGKTKTCRTNLMKINLEREEDIKKANRTKLKKDIRHVVYEKDNGICQICGKPLHPDHFTVDHIVPLSRGGINDMSNYRCVCRSCNEWKADALDEEKIQMLTDVGSRYLYRHPNSDMSKKFIRMMVRGVANSVVNKELYDNRFF